MTIIYRVDIHLALVVLLSASVYKTNLLCLRTNAQKYTCFYHLIFPICVVQDSVIFNGKIARLNFRHDEDAQLNIYECQDVCAL